MQWVAATLEEFGRQIGIADLRLNERGVTQLALQSGTTLAIEARAGEVLIYTTQMLAFEDEALKLRALRAADFHNGTSFPIQIGLTGSGMDASLVVLTRVPERSFNLPLLSQAFDYLCRWYEECRRNDARR